MELVKNSIKCSTCMRNLIKPVILPCGHSICKQHELNKRENGKKNIYCINCRLHYNIPEVGFTPNRALEELIKKKIESIDFGDEYKSATENCKKFDRLLNSLNELKNDPERRIEDVIGTLRIKIFSTKEQLITQIANDANEAIDKLNKYEIECKSKAAQIKDDAVLIGKLNSWENDLKQWQAKLGTFERDVIGWNMTLSDSKLKLSLLESEYSSFDDSLFLNRYSQFSNIDLFFGNNLDMIKNNSISIEVKNVKHLKNIEIKSNLSNKAKILGVEWHVNVQMKKNQVTKEYEIGVYLNLKPDNEIYKSVKVECELLILNRIDIKRSIKESFEKIYTVGNSQSWGFTRMIKLSDLMANNEIYDAQKDSFTAQAIIKNIQWNESLYFNNLNSFNRLKIYY